MIHEPGPYITVQEIRRVDSGQNSDDKRKRKHADGIHAEDIERYDSQKRRNRRIQRSREGL